LNSLDATPTAKGRIPRRQKILRGNGGEGEGIQRKKKEKEKSKGIEKKAQKVKLSGSIRRGKHGRNKQQIKKFKGVLGLARRKTEIKLVGRRKWDPKKPFKTHEQKLLTNRKRTSRKGD